MYGGVFGLQMFAVLVAPLAQHLHPNVRRRRARARLERNRQLAQRRKKKIPVTRKPTEYVVYTPKRVRVVRPTVKITEMPH